MMVTKTELESDWLLNSRSTIVFPATITSDTLEWFAARLFYLASTRALNILFCSNGGDSSVGIAIANLLQGKEWVHGYLIGDTASASATVWASCAHRYVYPAAMMGIHPVSWEDDTSRYDAARLRSRTQEFEWADTEQCRIYAAASNKSLEWWLDLYNQQGDVKWLTASQLVGMGMAKLITSGSEL